MERQGLLFGDVIVSNVTDDKIRGNIVKVEVNEDGFLVIKKRINGVIRTLTYTGVEVAKIIDNLNNTSPDKALSANQGNILNNKIISVINDTIKLKSKTNKLDVNSDNSTTINSQLIVTDDVKVNGNIEVDGDLSIGGNSLKEHIEDMSDWQDQINDKLIDLEDWIGTKQEVKPWRKIFDEVLDASSPLLIPLESGEITEVFVTSVWENAHSSNVNGYVLIDSPDLPEAVDNAVRFGAIQWGNTNTNRMSFMHIMLDGVAHENHLSGVARTMASSGNLQVGFGAMYPSAAAIPPPFVLSYCTVKALSFNSHLTTESKVTVYVR